jgi:NAD(P)H-dependent flavin oxidoreductase YrpB (nitropropane dioxygenase family)
MTTHPIICAPMNRVSDLTLALAVHKANCIPSFVIYNYQDSKWDEDFLKFKTEIAEYVSITGSHHFVVALKSELLLNRPIVIETIMKAKPAFMEIFDIVDISDKKLTNMFALFRKAGIKVIYKMLGARDIGELNQHIDGLVIKGPDAAARVGNLRIELPEKIKRARSMYPHLYIIASGGIATSQDIRDCLDAGANVVSLGTVFALSKESSISNETKAKLLDISFSEIKNIGQEHQNAIVFSTEPDIDGNHTAGLEAGLRSPTKGHVFIGKAIDTITEVKTVEQIVAELTCNL